MSISATTGRGIGDLLESMDGLLADATVLRRRFKVPHGKGSAVSLLYEQARVLERRDEASSVEILAEVSPALLRRMARYADGNT